MSTLEWLKSFITNKTMHHALTYGKKIRGSEAWLTWLILQHQQWLHVHRCQVPCCDDLPSIPSWGLEPNNSSWASELLSALVSSSFGPADILVFIKQSWGERLLLVSQTSFGQLHLMIFFYNVLSLWHQHFVVLKGHSTSCESCVSCVCNSSMYSSVADTLSHLLLTISLLQSCRSASWSKSIVQTFKQGSFET